MSKSRHPRNSSVKVRTASSYARSAAGNPTTLELQVARQLVTVLGGSAGNAGRGVLGMPFSGSNDTDQTTQAIVSLSRALATLVTAATANTSAITANTAAMHAGSVEKGVGGVLGLFGGAGSSPEESGGIGGFFGSLLGGFGSLLGLASLGTSLFQMFSGPAPQQVLNPYIPPIPQTLEVADAAGFPVAGTSADGSARVEPGSNTAPTAQPMQVTVNVSTMDSRSFLDNAPALASAVREAMLNMHPINQLVRESL
jgi:hypothetical protein